MKKKGLSFLPSKSLFVADTDIILGRSRVRVLLSFERKNWGRIEKHLMSKERRRDRILQERQTTKKSQQEVSLFFFDNRQTFVSLFKVKSEKSNVILSDKEKPTGGRNRTWKETSNPPPINYLRRKLWLRQGNSLMTDSCVTLVLLPVTWPSIKETFGNKVTFCKLCFKSLP